MHELGHAHGFEDHYTITGNIMYYAVSNRCTAGSHDERDYEKLWGDE